MFHKCNVPQNSDRTKTCKKLGGPEQNSSRRAQLSYRSWSDSQRWLSDDGYNGGSTFYGTERHFKALHKALVRDYASLLHFFVTRLAVIAGS